MGGANLSQSTMSGVEDPEEELLDYEDDEQVAEADKGDGVAKKKGYVGIHTSGFKDFLLKPELQRAIQDCGFEHPSEVQSECIPQAILGMDVLCQAKSGMGKTAVFVLTTLQQLDPQEGEIGVVVLCHTRELAYQINDEFSRFTKYLPDLKCKVCYGGVPISQDRDIFKETPREKQVMMFSATLSKEIRAVCKKFMTDPVMEVFIDDESKLTLHGLQQHYVKLAENEKNRKLNDLLDALEFNQVIIFVKSPERAKTLNQLLCDCNFPSLGRS